MLIKKRDVEIRSRGFASSVPAGCPGPTREHVTPVFDVVFVLPEEVRGEMAEPVSRYVFIWCAECVGELLRNGGEGW